LKSLLSPLLCAAGLAVVALSAGCDTAPARVPRETRVVVLSPDRPAEPLDLEVVNQIRIVLPGPDPGSNLEWEIVANNRRVLDQTSALKLAATSSPSEKPTTTSTFYALKPGKSVLRFVLVHPNEAEAIPVAKCVLVVRVNDD
jgi:hypothetical protein